ncbi:MAG: phosphoribosylaminoimidazolesuccinocarboxamide synthase [Gammaproteobacteria bacterium]|nr:phosphoribosylaminoimidazolesuccinocarboxamide synthase [Gammaproteobacteria bacterium]
MDDPEPSALFQSELVSLDLVGRGKVRDIYRIDDAHLLIVATDRLSAFDVVLPDPIPGKGEVLTAISNFWFERTSRIIANHLTHIDPATVISAGEAASLGQRAVVVRSLRPLPVEAVVRGYLIGSGWKDYRATGQVCGISLPAGLEMAEQLPEPLFTPSTKAEQGHHDQNISEAEVERLIGRDLTQQIKQASLAIYSHACTHARERGIIIADTKLEFGLDQNDQLVLIDEVLTPDSSRFWAAESYAPGTSPISFDKQFVRDYLETLDWNKKAPGPRLPAAVVQGTSERYREALTRIVGS